MLNTQKDIEDYVYKEAQDNLKDYIGKPIDNSAISYFKYLSKQIETSLQQLIPVFIKAPNVDISVDELDGTLIHIKLSQITPYQYSFNYSHISLINLKTHDLNQTQTYISSNFSIKCKKCGYNIQKDNGGYFSNEGDYSCDEYIIKNIIE